MARSVLSEILPFFSPLSLLMICTNTLIQPFNIFLPGYVALVLRKLKVFLSFIRASLKQKVKPLL